MKFILILSFLTNLSVHSADRDIEFDYEECLKLEKKLEPLYTDKTSKKAFEEIKNRNPKLIVFGEHHYDHLFWKMSHVYDYFKLKVNPQNSCLFSEISQDTTEVEFNEVLQGMMNDIFYSRYRLGFGPLYNHILNQGDDVVLVDAPRDQIGFDQQNDTMATWLYRRDSFMISRIQKALNSKECEAGIYNVGAQHVYDHLETMDENGNIIVLPYDSFGARVKREIPNTIIIDKGVSSDLAKCSFLPGIKSFLAPINHPLVDELFEVKKYKSSGDYILFLLEQETLYSIEYN